MKPAFIVIIIAPGPHFLQLKVVDTGKSADLDRTPLLTMRFPSFLSSMCLSNIADNLSDHRRNEQFLPIGQCICRYANYLLIVNAFADTYADIYRQIFSLSADVSFYQQMFLFFRYRVYLPIQGLSEDSCNRLYTDIYIGTEFIGIGRYLYCLHSNINHILSHYPVIINYYEKICTLEICHIIQNVTLSKVTLSLSEIYSYVILKDELLFLTCESRL